MSLRMEEENPLASFFERINALPRPALGRLVTSVFHVELAKSKVTVEIRPLGLIGKYVALELNIFSIRLSSSEIEQVLKIVADELKEKEMVEYVDLVKDGVGEIFLKGFMLGSKSPNAILVHYQEYYGVIRGGDPIILLVDTSNGNRL